MRYASVGKGIGFACLLLLAAAGATALAAADSAPIPPAAPAADVKAPPAGDAPKADEPKPEEAKALPPADPGKKEPPAAAPRDPAARMAEFQRRLQEARKAGASRGEIQRIVQEAFHDAIPAAEGGEAPGAPPAMSLQITAPKCRIETWDKGQHVVYIEDDDGSVKLTVEGDGDRIEAVAKDRGSFLEKFPDVARRAGIQAGPKAPDPKRPGEGPRKKGKGGEGGEPKGGKKDPGGAKVEKAEI